MGQNDSHRAPGTTPSGTTPTSPLATQAALAREVTPARPFPRQLDETNYRGRRSRRLEGNPWLDAIQADLED